jgi:23S rRNA (cytosine1962-C5)-methyltransferase
LAESPSLTLKLRRGEDHRLRAGHLWIFSNEVDVQATPLVDFPVGAQVRVVNDRDQFLGYAYVNPHALICARLLSRAESSPIDHSLIVHRLRQALALRTRLYQEPYYRLVFGESDGLPGLVLDRFGDVLVGQIATAGMEAMRGELEAAIHELVAPKSLVWRNQGSARDLEQLPKEIRAGIGAIPERLTVREGGLSYSIGLANAQKTGWFYDQSANRAQLGRFMPRSARMLDACSYAGAWALTALRAGAREALCVDSSAAALASAQANAAANGLAIQIREADVFDALDELHRAGERFDVIVLDPPAFIKRRKDLARGQAAYRKLNHLAMRLLQPDSLLVSCSCSYHLSNDDMVGLIQGAARQSSREVQIIATGGQSPDHPLHPAIAETRYLKAYFCRVTR